ncbi:RNA polymerase II-associated [Fomitopsis betulina]|nr:RNA polymerase II-associated [Fomitopsis betulina]
MSFKKSKLDLLIRVRYSNPLPAPPFPPKLIDVPTSASRYARPEFLDDIAADTPLPMVVDGDLGMPLDLSQWDCLWDENVDPSELNPTEDTAPRPDPKDLFLLADPSAGSFMSNGAGPSNLTSTPTPTALPHVTWLRRTEYLTREASSRPTAPQEAKHNTSAVVDVSRSAQIRDIEASFNATESSALSTLKHPNKPGVTAVDSYDIFPDAEIWANAYDLFRFSERPGERPSEVDDPRLDCAILRPMESDGDHFLAYYLTKDDETAFQFKDERLARSPDAPEEDEAVPFHFVRDYEVVKVEQEVPNEFLLVIDEGEAPEDEDQKDQKPGNEARAKGAYYKNIERKMLLKKKRQNAYESYHDKWDIIKITHCPMSHEEETEREEALAEVMDPMYLLNRGEVDAEGEIDDGFHDTHVVNGHADTSLAQDALEVFGE